MLMPLHTASQCSFEGFDAALQTHSAISSKVVGQVEVNTCFDEGTLEQRSRPIEGRRCSLGFWGS